MPKKDEFGSQPPLELVRQWMEYGFWFNLEKITTKHISGMQLIAAIGPPGGARSELPTRLQSKFNMLNFIFPDDEQIQRIFSTILNHKLSEDNFDTAIKAHIEKLTKSTLELYKRVSNKFLPTPSKCHYVFNLRDMSKVYQGLMQAHRNFCDNKESFFKLWVHECMRVFYDRLVCTADRNEFLVSFQNHA